MRRFSLLILAAVVSQACETTPANKGAVAPNIEPTADPSIKAVPMTYKPSAEEQAVIDKLVARHPGATGDGIRASLTDPEIVRIYLDDPEDQALLNEIYSKRQNAQLDEQRIGMAAARVSNASVFRVTLALVPTLGDNSNVTARVIRRRNPPPTDLIVLSEKTADPAAFGTALGVLTRNRASEGSLTSKDVHIDIEGAAIPKVWDEGMQALVADELRRLAEAKVQNIPGIGKARTTEILARQ